MVKTKLETFLPLTVSKCPHNLAMLDRLSIISFVCLPTGAHLHTRPHTSLLITLCPSSCSESPVADWTATLVTWDFLLPDAFSAYVCALGPAWDDPVAETAVDFAALLAFDHVDDNGAHFAFVSIE